MDGKNVRNDLMFRKHEIITMYDANKDMSKKMSVTLTMSLHDAKRLIDLMDNYEQEKNA